MTQLALAAWVRACLDRAGYRSDWQGFSAAYNFPNQDTTEMEISLAKFAGNRLVRDTP
jgi:hypothetical protein